MLFLPHSTWRLFNLCVIAHSFRMWREFSRYEESFAKYCHSIFLFSLSYSIDLSCKFLTSFNATSFILKYEQMNMWNHTLPIRTLPSFCLIRRLKVLFCWKLSSSQLRAKEEPLLLKSTWSRQTNNNHGCSAEFNTISWKIRDSLTMSWWFL